MHGRWRDADPGKPKMRHLIATLTALTLAGLGCPAAGTPNQKPNHPSSQPILGGSGASTDVPAAAAPRFTPPDQVPAARRVWAYVDGQRRVMDIDEARSVGLTVVDLSDDWVPYIFWSQTPGGDDYKANQYVDNYVRLANDKTNLNGAKLRRGQHNYLEVYGIPPSLTVLRRRLIDDEQRPCYDKLDYELFREYHGPVRVVDARGSKAIEKRYYGARGHYRRALRKARVRTLEALLERKAYRKVARKYQKAQWRYRAIRAMQRRLVCEGMFGRRKPRIKPGIINWQVRQALRRFERKHDIYGWGMIFQKTGNALGRKPVENHYESLKRVIAERVISAAGILEDGTAGRRASFVGADGNKHRVRNLVEEFTRAVLHQMGLTDSEKAQAFIKAHSEDDFKRLLVAVKLPPLPEYYADHMELETIINRGDIWYDLPYDDKGRRIPQPRSRLPSLTFYVNYNGHKVPLVRWRTTIGGWNLEMRHNEEYVKYKVSDIGKRVWKRIVAGPVWVPPKATPSHDMVKIRPVRGRSQRVVAQSTVGPGYASAYGLVAAFHWTKAGHDNQIRTHGSVNYMSILGRFSHGCHRLFNYRAVRLFSYVLRHRKFKRIGQSHLAFRHRFEHKGEEFQINLHTRGYYYELTPPVPVNVLEGRIRGKRKQPYEDYVKKPGKVYQEDIRQRQPKKNGSAMTQKQTI